MQHPFFPIFFPNQKAFGASVTEQDLIDTGKFFVSSGLHDAGYKWVNTVSLQPEQFSYNCVYTPGSRSIPLLYIVHFGRYDLICFPFLLLVQDDGWDTKTRDADGKLQVDLVKFPSGIKGQYLSTVVTLAVDKAHTRTHTHTRSLSFSLAHSPSPFSLAHVCSLSCSFSFALSVLVVWLHGVCQNGSTAT